MKFLQATRAVLLSYAVAAVLLFGGPLHAIGFLTLWNDRLALLSWPLLLVFGLATGLVCAFLGVRFGAKKHYAPAFFVFFSIICSTIVVGVYTEHKRSEVIEKFNPDIATRASFFKSLRSAPRDFQFFLHGAALKDCTPYAWSYRRMVFYELPPNVAVNVLPTSWIEECQIKRTR